MENWLSICIIFKNIQSSLNKNSVHLVRTLGHIASEIGTVRRTRKIENWGVELKNRNCGVDRDVFNFAKTFHDAESIA